MKTLVLDGSTEKENVSENIIVQLTDLLKESNDEVNWIALKDQKIAGCLGCFGCWLKTPGKCVINDQGSDLPKKVIQSDRVIVLSPITFGMYSSELKKAFDRFACPILLPFFEEINGEIHHFGRYDRYPLLIAIGTLPNPDEEIENTFKALVSRNGINLHMKTTSIIFYNGDKSSEIKGKLFSALLTGDA